LEQLEQEELGDNPSVDQLPSVPSDEPEKARPTKGELNAYAIITSWTVCVVGLTGLF